MCGVPEDFIWPNFVSQLTGINDVANLGVPGASINLSVRLFATYINNFGPPKIVLCNFPDFHRYEAFDDLGKILMGNSASAAYEHYSYSAITSYMQSLQAINFLEALCKTNKIKLVWQGWVSKFSSLEELSVSEEFFKSKFKNFKTLDGYDIWNPFEIGDPKCCNELYKKTKEFFHFGYDRYSVPKKMQSKLIDEEFYNKKLVLNHREIIERKAHLGAHAHWHWAKNLVEGI